MIPSHSLAFVCVCLIPLPGLAQAQEPPLPEGAIARLGNRRLAAPGRAGVALSPDGKLLATGGQPGIYIWDADAARILRKFDWHVEGSTAFLNQPGGSSYQSWLKALAWSANGRLIATIDADTKFQVWNAALGKPLWRDKHRKVEAPNAYVSAFRFVAGDRFLAVLSWAHRDQRTWHLELWDVETGTRSLTWAVDKDKRPLLNALGDGYDIHHVALSPSGDCMAWLASPPRDAKQSKSAVFLYQTATGKLLHTVKDLPRTYRADLPDEGETLVLHPIRPDKVENIITAQAAVVSIPDGRLKFHCAYRFRPPIRRNAYSFHGQAARDVWLTRSAVRFRDSLLTLDDIGMIRWDPRSGKKLEEYNDPFSDFAISADGKRIAIRDGMRLGISDGKLAALTTPGVFARAPLVRFLPDGRLLGYDSGDEEDGLVQVWEPRQRKLLDTRRFYTWQRFYIAAHAQGPNEPLPALPPLVDRYIRPDGLSNNGTRVLAAKERAEWLLVRWFDTRSGREVGRHEIPYEDMYPKDTEVRWFSEDGSMFGYVAPDRSLALFDCAKHKVVLTVGIVPAKEWKKPLWNYQSAGYHRLIWACPRYDDKDSASQNVAEHAIWDRQGHLLRRFTLPAKHAYGISRMVLRHLLSPDGRTLAVCDKDDWKSVDIVFYETATGRERGRIRCPEPVSVFRFYERQSADISPDGTLLATGQSKSILLWDLARPLSGKAAEPPPRNAKEAERLWEMLGNHDPAEADSALWALVAAPEQTLRLVQAPPQPKPGPDAKRVPILLKQLDSDSFAVRDAASKELFDVAETHLPALRAAHKAASLESRRRIDGVIEHVQARRKSAELRQLRVLHVLERIGGEAARQQVAAIAARRDGGAATYEAELVLSRWKN